jgi:hypothetical protein
MSKSNGSSDEAIGRPGPWREGRYQQPGKTVDPSVVGTDDKAQDGRKPEDAPVTRRDYEQH